MLIDIHLGHNKEVCLTYELYDNSVTALFYNRMCMQENNVVSRTQFYNLGETKQDVENGLLRIIEQIKQIEPALLGNDTHANLNQLHINFPKYHNLYSGNAELFDLLRQFNYYIHFLENKRYVNPQPRFLFACENDSGVALPEEAYDMFTPHKRMGEMYMNYPHVGKHFTELWMDNDVEIPIEQIQLTSKMASCVYCWLGEDVTFSNRAMRSMHQFYKQIHHKLPYRWGDSRLAIGYLPLGHITHNIDLYAVSQNKYVHSWTCR